MTTETCVVLLVESDILVRHPLAEYLRDCGLTVFEAATGEDAVAALQSTDVAIHVVLADMSTPGSGFAFCDWVRRHRPEVQVLMAGSVERTVDGAGDLCAEGPALAKPYEHRLVLQRIRRAIARRQTAKS